MALTDDFTFQLGDTGFILNNPDPLAYPTVDITKISGLDSAPVRSSVKDREGTDGGYVDAEFDQARTIVLSGTLYDDANNTELTLDQLKADWAPSKVPMPLSVQFPGVGQRMLWVNPIGCNYDIDQLRRLGMCSINFTAIAGDPRIYAGTASYYSQDVTDVLQTGFGFNLAFNFGFGGITPNISPALLYNAGNRTTPLNFRMYGPYINPHIINDTTGDEMIFDMVVTTNTSWLEVDTATHTVRFNGPFGVQNRRNTLRRPSWFDLQPGYNSIRFRVEGNGGFGTHMETRYRSAWR